MTFSYFLTTLPYLLVLCLTPEGREQSDSIFTVLIIYRFLGIFSLPLLRISSYIPFSSYLVPYPLSSPLVSYLPLSPLVSTYRIILYLDHSRSSLSRLFHFPLPSLFPRPSLQTKEGCLYGITLKDKESSIQLTLRS